MHSSVVLRSALKSALRSAANFTMFSKRRRIRSVMFEVLSEHTTLMTVSHPDKESYVFRAGDEWIGRHIFLDGEFDFHKFVAAIEVLRSKRGSVPKVLIDVGANIGTICIPGVARGYVERAIAVEAEAMNFRLLKTNICLNQLEGLIRPVQLAVGPIDGETLSLCIADENYGDFRVRRPADDLESDAVPQAGAIAQVEAGRMDTICADELDQEVLIWMDVQGFEGHALTGATELLSRRNPLILEFSPQLIRESDSFAALVHSLANYESFCDLEQPNLSRPMTALTDLYEELGEGGRFTDILVL